MEITIKDRSANMGDVVSGLRAILEEHDLNGEVEQISRSRVKLINIRLRKVVYNCYPYAAGDNPNYWIDYTEDGKPEAVNYHMPLRRPVSRGRFLQWCHWAALDNAVNKFLDDLDLPATFRSAYGKLRSGFDWAPICTGERCYCPEHNGF